MSFGIQLDLSMDAMEEDRIKKKYFRQIKELSKKTHFNRIEVESLVLIFHKIRKDGNMKTEGITRMQFQEVLHKGFDITDDVLLDRITHTIEGQQDRHSFLITMEMWVSALSLFLRGSLEEKINHCFEVYNLMGDGMLGRENMFTLLKKMIVSETEEDAEEIVRDMIELIIKKMDLDRDGKISYMDFKQTVLNQPMLLESFGQCLPSRMVVHAFETTIFPNTTHI